MDVLKPPAELVIGGHAVEVLFEAEDGEHPREQGEADREIASLEAGQGPTGDADAAGQLAERHPATHASQAQTLPKSLSASLGLRIERI
jgi:hypothetical protein